MNWNVFISNFIKFLYGMASILSLSAPYTSTAGAAAAGNFLTNIGV